MVQLATGPELQPRRLPRIYLERDASADGFPPTVFVSQPFEEDATVAVSPEQAIAEGLPGPAAAPHAHSRSGCGCADCQSGDGQTFPGYDKLGYELQGGCPPVVISEEWCRRPFFVDVFAGPIWGNEFVNNQIGQQTSLFAGGRLGWDFNGSWGAEGRLGWSQVDIYNLAGPTHDRQAELFLWDVSVVHYFGSNLKLRPYFAVGLGMVTWDYDDVVGNPVEEQVFGVPIGIGLKRRWDDWLVFRLDLTDNMAFGGGTQIGTQHNFSITGNVELRFGGPRTSYWAWSPGKHYTW